jgi:glycosyltransferase involved in cell wall biosynthesis
MTAIHQILAAASPGDAITNVALELRDLFRRVGPSEVYARHVTPSIANDVRELREFPSGPTRDLLLYHASIGEPHVHAFLLSRREPIVLMYHNVTPARYFQSWDPVFAELLDLGRSELFELRHRVAVAIAVSTYNAVELELIGYPDVKVVPPIVNPYRLARLEASRSMLNHLDTMLGAPFLVSVGQLFPHKRPDLLVNAMHIAATYLDCQAYLMLIGHMRLPAYTAAIIGQIREYNLPRVHVVGAVSTPDLVAMYRRALALVTVSEHEGFCVPLLEAMTFDTPIIARSCAAIPETVGDAALLLPADAGPTLVAEAISEVVESKGLRDELAHRGRARLSEFDAERASARLLEAVLEVA